eukprot:GSChrysophyteH1.ASY1.ANO1.746.1 assembled CDS
MEFAGDQSIELDSGATLPLIGFGTYKLKGEQCYEAVLAALGSGYRLVDTARVYRNEVEVGRALKDSEICRESIFLTSKVPPTEQGEDAAYDAIQDSLVKLGVSYIDLMLIHWPGKSKTPLESSANADARRGSWRALIRAKREGLVRDIGVSNFSISHLDDPCFKAAPTGPPTICSLPALNQIECHPLCQQKEIRSYCAQSGIAVQAYSSLCCGNVDVLNGTMLKSAFNAANLSTNGFISSPQQLLLTWALQQGLAVIPKASNAERIANNYSFMIEALKRIRATTALLTPDIMALLDLEKDVHLCWFGEKVK